MAESHLKHKQEFGDSDSDAKCYNTVMNAGAGSSGVRLPIPKKLAHRHELSKVLKRSHGTKLQISPNYVEISTWICASYVGEMVLMAWPCFTGGEEKNT